MKTSLNKRIAIFPGTFDPFTIGHMSLVERALNMLDEIVIAIGVNEAKSQYFSVDERVRMLEDLLDCGSCPSVSCRFYFKRDSFGE